VIKLPSGDLQFYKMTPGDGNIQIAGFQYLTHSNTLTELVQIGTISGFEGIAFREFGTQRFGKYYAVYQYPRYDPQGLVIIRLDTHEFEYRIIPFYDYYGGFSASYRIDIVSENHLVIALADRLEFYDFASDTSQTLLDGEDYHCIIGQIKRVYAMPTGHFMYIKDTCEDIIWETWFIFDSQGNLQFTKIMTDFWFSVSVTGWSFGQDFDFVHGRFYIKTHGMAYDSALLECHFPNPDSLHVFIVGTPVSVDEHLFRIVRFGDDRILRLYFDYGPNAYNLYMSFSPLENNPGFHRVSFGHIEPHIDNINDKLVTISARYEDYIYISVLCTLDFPTSHTFTFPAPTINIYFPALTFSHDDQLFMISDGTLYAFMIDFSHSNTDEIAAPPLHTLFAYPNPFTQQTALTYSLKEPGMIGLSVYNLKGQLVADLDTGHKGSGQHSVLWDGRDHAGRKLSSGVYLLRLKLGEKIIRTKKVTLCY